MFSVIIVGIITFSGCSLAKLVKSVCCSSRLCYTKVRISPNVIEQANELCLEIIFYMLDELLVLFLAKLC